MKNFLDRQIWTDFTNKDYKKYVHKLNKLLHDVEQGKGVETRDTLIHFCMMEQCHCSGAMEAMANKLIKIESLKKMDGFVMRQDKWLLKIPLWLQHWKNEGMLPDDDLEILKTHWTKDIENLYRRYVSFHSTLSSFIKDLEQLPDTQTPEQPTAPNREQTETEKTLEWLCRNKYTNGKKYITEYTTKDTGSLYYIANVGIENIVLNAKNAGCIFYVETLDKISFRKKESICNYKESIYKKHCTDYQQNYKKEC